MSLDDRIDEPCRRYVLTGIGNVEGTEADFASVVWRVIKCLSIDEGMRS